jgi:hypothetical protein
MSVSLYFASSPSRLVTLQSSPFAISAVVKDRE